MVKLPLKDEEEDDDNNENRTQQIEKKIKKNKMGISKTKKKKQFIYGKCFFTRIVCIYLYKENPQN